MQGLQTDLPCFQGRWGWAARQTTVPLLCSRAGGRVSEAKEAEGASQVEAGKRLEELRRRRGETESEEFEKLKQKQQEAALELEELKKKREERRKVLEEEGQRKRQEEAERKAREEVRRAARRASAFAHPRHESVSPWTFWPRKTPFFLGELLRPFWTWFLTSAWTWANSGR